MRFDLSQVASMPWSNHPNITAIIYAGAPGEQAGPALVDILWGKVNPSGRLPFTIADVSFTLTISNRQLIIPSE